MTDPRIVQLCQQGFDEPHANTGSTQLALKSLANILLLEEKTRQNFVDLGYSGKVADRVRNTNKESREDELICSRILFLLTYNTNLDFNSLFDDHSLACKISENIASHALQYEHLNASDEGSAQDARSGAHPSLNDRALSESLKLLFNLIQHYPQRVDDFTSTVPDILLILSRIPLEEKPIQPPVNYLINALLNLDIPGKPSMNDSSIESTALFPFPDAACHTQRLVDILERASRGGNEEELESTLVPLVTLLRRINGMAPPEAQLCLRKRLLPPSRERDRPLGKSDTFSSRLLRLSTSPVAPNLKEGISSLLFELSDNDPATFIRNVGYGHAAGFLMTHNISLPESVINDVNANGVTSVDGLEVNPITGQRLDREAKDLGPDMTDEEKEREAEKLFVLFERLKATGVVNAINPVEQAARQGTLEEVE